MTEEDNDLGSKPDTPCWEWRGATDGRGYGKRWVGGKSPVKVTRLLWEQVNGPIPAGMVVMHRCDNTLCVRLDHLRLGTRSDNSRDMVLKGRQRKTYTKADACRHGHAYPDNAYYDSKGWAHCRVCDAARHRAARAAR